MCERNHALVPDVVEFGERKDLEPAAVGEDGPVPVHEFVEPPCRLYKLVPGAHIEVVGIREDDLRARLLQVARQHALDGRLRADGHIHGRFDIAVRGMKDARPRARFWVSFDNFKGKFLCQNARPFFTLPVFGKECILSECHSSLLLL